jgi:anti-sigma factor RsiW
MTTPTMTLDCDGFADALADYLEGDASDSVRSAVEAHATSCAACGLLLADLTAVRTDAAALPPLAPSRDLWSGISERIDARVLPLEAPRVTRSLSARPIWLRPAVAAAALVALTAGVTHYLTRASLAPAASSAPLAAANPSARQQVASVTPTSDSSATINSTVTENPAASRATRGAAPTSTRLVSVDPTLSAAEPVFTSEIGKLRKIVKERRAQLDPRTVAVLEQSIAVMDSAIAQSRAALAKDPASGFLASQLNRSLEKKVELLRTAALLPART